MSIEDSYNFRRVNDRLTTSGLLTPEQLGALHADDYDAVINLLPDGHEHGVPDERRIVEEQGLDYVHIPVDFDAPTPADLAAFEAAMEAYADATVHVHCAANYRVTAFYSLHALRHGLMTDAEANDLVQSVWNPAEFPAWAAFIEREGTRARGRAEGGPAGPPST